MDRLLLKILADIYYNEGSLDDLKEDEGLPSADPPVAPDPNKVTREGVNTLITAGRLTIRTHEGHMQYGGYIREELIIADPAGKPS